MRPNILFVMADQWRAHATGYNGDPNARTPNLDRFASEGTNFRQALSGHPLCVPFRAALLTGRHGHANGVGGHYSALPSGTSTMAHRLSGMGYRTAYFGKWHLYDHPAPGGGHDEEHIARTVIPPEARGGFEHWKAFEAGNVMIDPWLHGDGDLIARRRRGYQPQVLVDVFLDYLDDPADAPWFAVLSTEPPHNPYDEVPSRYARRYRPDDIVLRPNVPRAEPVESRARCDLAGYYAHIEATDEAIGRLLEALDSRGLSQDTLVLFFADHGDLHGSHGQFRKTSPLDESVRIPFLARWPDQIPKGRTSDALFSEIDVYPTLLGLLGAPAPSKLHGRDLSALFRGSATTGRDRVLIQHVDGLGHEFASRLPWRAIRTGDAMYGCVSGAEQWLYDLRVDPFQVQNRAHDGGAAELRASMRQQFLAALREVQDPFPPPPFEDPPAPVVA